MIIKCDVCDAFRVVPVAASDWWHLGFCWKRAFYTERALPFGLPTAHFELSAEDLHWILLPRGWGRLHHYLNDFISILSPAEVAAGHGAWATSDWIWVASLAAPRKDSQSTVFGTGDGGAAPSREDGQTPHDLNAPSFSLAGGKGNLTIFTGFFSRVVRLGHTL
jgi:hypothetical protein